MYDDRFSSPARVRPASLGMAIGLSAALMGAMMFAAPTIIITPTDDPITITNIPLDEPSPAPEPKPELHVARQPIERVAAPDPLVPLPATSDSLVVVDAPPLPPTPLVGSEVGPIAAEPTPLPTPVIVQPAIDARYAADLQPGYPSEERRASREGRVVVRVLVGIDGRVERAERVSAASDAFWRATLDQAMRKWRFRPATRDGVPFAAWRTMTLTFRLQD